MNKSNKKSIDCSSNSNGKKELVLELQKILKNAEILQEQIMPIVLFYGEPGLNQNYGDKFCVELLNNIDWIIHLVGDEIELRIQEILNSK